MFVWRLFREVGQEQPRGSQLRRVPAGTRGLAGVRHDPGRRDARQGPVAQREQALHLRQPQEDPLPRTRGTASKWRGGDSAASRREASWSLRSWTRPARREAQRHAPQTRDETQRHEPQTRDETGHEPQMRDETGHEPQMRDETAKDAGKTEDDTPLPPGTPGRGQDRPGPLLRGMPHRGVPVLRPGEGLRPREPGPAAGNRTPVKERTQNEDARRPHVRRP